MFFNHNYKATLLLSEVHDSSQERLAYQHCSRSSMKCHALPLLCRGKTAVTKMIILAFQAIICLQKSNLHYSDFSFCLAQNINYIRGSSVHFANQAQPSGFGPLQTHSCSKSRINTQITPPSCISQAQQPTSHPVIYLWSWKAFFILLFSKSKVKTTSSSHSGG